MKIITESKPILYWYARVLGDEIWDFHFIYQGEEEDVPPSLGHIALDNAYSLDHPAMCIN